MIGRARHTTDKKERNSLIVFWIKRVASLSLLQKQLRDHCKASNVLEISHQVEIDLGVAAETAVATLDHSSSGEKK